MNWIQDEAQIEKRDDGTFVVQAEVDGSFVPFHVTPEYSPELFAAVCAFLGVVPPEPTEP